MQLRLAIARDLIYFANLLRVNDQPRPFWNSSVQDYRSTVYAELDLEEGSTKTTLWL